MHFSTLLELAALLSAVRAAVVPAELDVREEDLPSVDDLPHELWARGDGSSSNSPIDLIIDMSKNTAAFDTFEADCMAILCFGAPNILQREKPNLRSKNYRASGASLKPFQDNQLKVRKTRRINSRAVSAEEYPHESTVQGGSGAILVGVSLAAQRSQGQYMKTAYSRYKIKPTQWFKNKYINIPSNSKYCKALMQNPPDTSVCTDKDPLAFVNMAFRKDSTGGGSGAPFIFKNLGFGVDKW